MVLNNLIFHRSWTRIWQIRQDPINGANVIYLVGEIKFTMEGADCNNKLFVYCLINGVKKTKTKIDNRKSKHRFFESIIDIQILDWKTAINRGFLISREN